MKTIIEGHTYGLASFEGTNPQTLQFIHKEPEAKDPTVLNTICDGTTNEEVLDVLINRVKFLNAKFPCRENSLCITDLESARNWLLQRTRERVKRDVEGKNIA